MVDRLEQAGYVERVPDLADRRRVVVHLVPERMTRVSDLLDTLTRAAARELGRYAPDQLAAIGDFLDRMAGATRTEREHLRETAAGADSALDTEHAAPLGGLREARLLFRNGASDVRLVADPGLGELYRATFRGTVPQVRLRDGVVSVQYRGGLFDFRKRQATIALNPSVAWAIEFRGGASKIDAYLESVRLQSLEFSGGATRLDVALGAPSGVVPIRFTGGATEVRVTRPADAAFQLAVDGGAARIALDGQRIGGTNHARLESAGAARADDRYVLEVTGGVSSLTVKGV